MTAPSPTPSSSSDPWADDSDLPDADYDKLVAERNWNRLQDVHGMAGYRDGIAEGKEKSLQTGFDQGFAEGAEIGVAIGRLRGIVSTLIQIRMTSFASISPGTLNRITELHADLEALSAGDIFTASDFREPSREGSVKGGGSCKGDQRGACSQDSCEGATSETTGGGTGSKPGACCQGTDGKGDAAADSRLTGIVNQYRARVNALLDELGYDL
ncbi:hypothetical protein HK104_005480 [Borealophlyctis nickersoniae]|nr:hypothetical protein HK104_005480 [Borealophlyctis nickersoniae]